jgi:hypothetical protein
MDQYNLHRQEQLEAEIRQLRQALRNLTESIIAGSEKQTLAFAIEAKDFLDS